MAQAVTGYGPSKRLYFDGDDEKYELWEVKFLAHLRLHKLHAIVDVQDGAEASENDSEKNADVFAELVQYLDDKSLSLIIRDSKDD
jgi:hypothetical protein